MVVGPRAGRSRGSVPLGREETSQNVRRTYPSLVAHDQVESGDEEGSSKQAYSVILCKLVALK